MSITCTPQALMNGTQGFFSLSDRECQVISDYLLCQILSIGIRPTLDISGSSSNGNTILTWLSDPVDSFEIWRSINGAPFSLLTTVPGTSRTFTDTGVLNVGDEWDYQIRTVVGSKKGSFSAIAGAGFQIFFNNNAGLTTYSFPNIVVMYSSGVNQCGATNCANLTSVSLPRLHDYINSGTGELIFSNDNTLTSVNLNSFARATFVKINSNPILPTLSFPSLLTVSGTGAFSFDLGANGSITSITAPLLTTAGFRSDNCPLLTTLSLPSLTNGLFGFSSEGVALTSATLPSLTTCGEFGLGQNGNILSWAVPKLATVTGTAFFSDSDKLLTSVSAPSLVSVATILDWNSALSLGSISLPSLTTVGQHLRLFNMPNLKSFSAPVLTSIGGDIDLSGTGITSLTLMVSTVNPLDYQGAGQNGAAGFASTSLKTLSWPNIVFPNNCGIDFEGCALDVTSINAILRRAALSPGLTGATFLLDLGTNAAPTGQGLVDKANLIAAGNTVLTN